MMKLSDRPSGVSFRREIDRGSHKEILETGGKANNTAIEAPGFFLFQLDFTDEIRDLVQYPDDNSPSEERRIVTLDEFLQRAKGHIGVMIELKYYGFDYGMADAVVDLVSEYNMQDEVIIMSLNLDGVRQVIQGAPEIRTGFVSALRIRKWTQIH